MINRRTSLAMLAILSLGFAAPAFAQPPRAFSQDAFAAALAAGKPILVHVTAGWCPTCRAQKAVLAKLEDDPRFKDILVFDVDFDAQKPVVAAFKARSQSTLVGFKGGVETARAVGQTDPGVIDALLAQAI
jgi:thioredoxin 1